MVRHSDNELTIVWDHTEVVVHVPASDRERQDEGTEGRRLRTVESECAAMLLGYPEPVHENIAHRVGERRVFLVPYAAGSPCIAVSSRCDVLKDGRQEPEDLGRWPRPDPEPVRFVVAAERQPERMFGD